jgi:hypothetical protein
MTKRRVGSQIGSLTFDHYKSGIALIYLCARGVPHIVGKKALKEGYNFSLDLTSIEGLHQTLWASKVVKVPILEILEQNDIWVKPCGQA